MRVSALALIPCDRDYRHNLAVAASSAGIGARRLGIRQLCTGKERRGRNDRLAELSAELGLLP